MTIRNYIPTSLDRTVIEEPSYEEKNWSTDGTSFRFDVHECFRDLALTFVPLYSLSKVISKGDGIAMATIGWEASLLAGYSVLGGLGYGLYKLGESILS